MSEDEYVGVITEEFEYEGEIYERRKFKKDLISHRTERGFSKFKFKDVYGSKCSLQKSSLATESAIWFGIDDVNPKVMASKASSLGIKTKETTGWVAYPIPEDVSMSSRMHLTQEQVKQLLPILKKFAETGELS